MAMTLRLNNETEKLVNEYLKTNKISKTMLINESVKEYITKNQRDNVIKPLYKEILNKRSELLEKLGE